MGPGCKASVTREGETAGETDDFEGWDYVCRGLYGENMRRPFPDRTVIIIASTSVLISDIIIIITTITIITLIIAIHQHQYFLHRYHPRHQHAEGCFLGGGDLGLGFMVAARRLALGSGTSQNPVGLPWYCLGLSLTGPKPKKIKS